ncbi:MAG: hypothetical protein JWM59_209 [Verrucomicrobiales bacterium]|nr:hypothetical protein [Verrucomicrobiales bacterium]
MDVFFINHIKMIIIIFGRFRNRKTTRACRIGEFRDAAMASPDSSRATAIDGHLNTL